MKLPDAKIAVVRRSDGSGTTFNFTNYLSKASAEWKDKVGSDLLVKWPVGDGREGQRRHCASGQVDAELDQLHRVRPGAAVEARLRQPAEQGRQVHQARAARLPGRGLRAPPGAARCDFDQLLVDAPGEAAYPVVVTVFAQMKKSGGTLRSRATLNFLQWSLERGAADAAHLGYVPLPSQLVTDIKKYWTASFKFSS